MIKNQNTAAIGQNLEDAGCDEETIRSFLLCLQQGDRRGEERILAQHRALLLHDLHQIHHHMESIEALLAQLKG